MQGAHGDQFHFLRKDFDRIRCMKFALQRAFSGITVGIVGGVIGIHRLLALSATARLAITSGLLAFTLRSRPAT